MKLTGIAVWAHTSKPKAARTHEGKTYPAIYAIDIFIEQKEARKMKKEGFNVKKVTQDIKGIEGAIGKYTLTIKKNAYYEGNPNKPPIVVDSQLKPYTGLIGNGSKVSVVFAAKEWTGFGTTGIAAGLRKIQVIDLVEYDADEDLEEFGEVEGFAPAKVVAAVVNSATTDVDDDLDF